MQQFLLMLDGMVEMRKRRATGSIATSLKRGAAWGDARILSGKPSDVTGIVASSTATALVMRRDTFLACLEPLMQSSRRSTIAFLATTCSAFSGVSR